MSSVAILGGGAWGATLARLAHEHGHTVRVWSRSGDLSLEEAIVGADVLLSCLPMAAVETVSCQIRAIGLEAKSVLVSTTKGLDRGTAQPPSHVWRNHFPEHSLVVLSGPNLAAEITRGLPAATVVASADEAAVTFIQGCFASERFRVYTSTDWRGVELGGVLKNVIALAAGVSDGLGLGSNAKAALITRGMTEMIRVGIHWGGEAGTFYGLSGLGDLLTTCYSALSRNYRIGFALGEGKALPAILDGFVGTAEGVYTAPVLARYAHGVGLDVPITDQVCALLAGTTPPTEALMALMSRRLREE